MKKQLMLLAAILFLNQSLFARKNYIAYHQQIMHAENLFMAGKYDSSLKLYNKLFNEFDPFAKDCFNALQISLLTPNLERSKIYFGYCFQNGVTWKMLEVTKNVIAVLNKNEKYKNEIKAIYEIEKVKYFAKLNWDARAKVDVMRITDGYFHEFPIPVFYKSKRTFEEVITPNLHDTFYQVQLDKNTLDFIAITKKYGFPGENMIGVASDDIYEFTSIVEGTLFRPVSDLIFYHNRATFFLLQYELLQAIKDGELHPAEYAICYEWAFYGNKRTDKISTIDITIPNMEKRYNIWLNSTNYSKDIIFVDKCRAEIGMASTEHELAKRKFEKEMHLDLFAGLFWNM